MPGIQRKVIIACYLNMKKRYKMAKKLSKKSSEKHQTPISSILIVVVGVLWLLNNMQIIDLGLKLVPTLLIILGIFLIVRNVK